MRTLNDPLYGSINLRGPAVALLDTPAIQRLHRIRQLGFAYLVYRSANHTRFEHPIGAYHLMDRLARQMRERGQIGADDEEDLEVAKLAALLHDAGHWPIAHVAEDFGVAGADHERVGERWVTRGPVAEILESSGIPGAPERIAAMIRHQSPSPLGALVAGAVDVDRLDYMRRDAYYTGLPMAMDQARLLDALVIEHNPRTGRRDVMLMERGVNELAQMVWHRHMLYRNVYWHRVVRVASSMARTVFLQAVDAGVVTVAEAQTWSDDDLLSVLGDRLRREMRPESKGTLDILGRLANRRLYRSVLRAPAAEFPRLSAPATLRLEARLAERAGVPQGHVLVDVPHKPGMYEPDIFIARRSGDVVHRSELTPDDGYALNACGAALYQASGCAYVHAASDIGIGLDTVLADAHAIQADDHTAN